MRVWTLRAATRMNGQDLPPTYVGPVLESGQLAVVEARALVVAERFIAPWQINDYRRAKEKAGLG